MKSFFLLAGKIGMMKTLMKKNILIIIIICIFCVTVTITALATRAVADYVIARIIAEQNDHYYTMRENIVDLKRAIKKIEPLVARMQKHTLTQKEKEDVRSQLRAMEEIALRIARETSFYDEDTTVHLFFSPRAQIVAYFANTHSIPLHVERFVRIMEEGLFRNYLTRDQKATILESFTLLKEEVEKL